MEGKEMLTLIYINLFSGIPFRP